jgi:hypothetical protein
MKLEYSRYIFEKKPKYQISSKYVQWKSSCPMRAVGRTDITKLIAAILRMRLKIHATYV